jgi:hypothetical protein
MLKKVVCPRFRCVVDAGHVADASPASGLLQAAVGGRRRSPLAGDLRSHASGARTRAPRLSHWLDPDAGHGIPTNRPDGKNGEQTTVLQNRAHAEKGGLSPFSLMLKKVVCPRFRCVVDAGHVADASPASGLLQAAVGGRRRSPLAGDLRSHASGERARAPRLSHWLDPDVSPQTGPGKNGDRPRFTESRSC